MRSLMLIILTAIVSAAVTVGVLARLKRVSLSIEWGTPAHQYHAGKHTSFNRPSHPWPTQRIDKAAQRAVHHAPSYNQFATGTRLPHTALLFTREDRPSTDTSSNERPRSADTQPNPKASDHVTPSTQPSVSLKSHRNKAIHFKAVPGTQPTNSPTFHYTKKDLTEEIQILQQLGASPTQIQRYQKLGRDLIQISDKLVTLGGQIRQLNGRKLGQARLALLQDEQELDEHKAEKIQAARLQIRNEVKGVKQTKSSVSPRAPEGKANPLKPVQGDMSAIQRKFSQFAAALREHLANQGIRKHASTQPQSHMK